MTSTACDQLTPTDLIPGNFTFALPPTAPSPIQLESFNPIIHSAGDPSPPRRGCWPREPTMAFACGPSRLEIHTLNLIAVKVETTPSSKTTLSDELDGEQGTQLDAGVQTRFTASDWGPGTGCRTGGARAALFRSGIWCSACWRFAAAVEGILNSGVLRALWIQSSQTREEQRR